MRQPEDAESGRPDHVLMFVLGDVPERWRGRARQISFIPLLPDEADSVLTGREGEAVNEDDEALLKLAARGLSAPAIARASGLSIRTVHRRLARLREQLQVESSAELAAELSRRGFGE